MIVQETHVVATTTDGRNGGTRRGGPNHSGALVTRHTPYVFALPIVASVLMMYVLPILLGFVLSFTSWGSFSKEIRWVGTRNLRFLVDDAPLRIGLFATLKFAVGFAVLANFSALVLALMLEQTNRINGFFRSVLFIPVLISPLAAGYLFRAILDPAGPLNSVIEATMFWRDGSTISWLGEPSYTIYVLSAIQAWKSFGLYMLIYIAGLNSIPRELLESARIDGATGGQTIRYMKLPLIGPALTFNVVLSVVGAMQTFELILATTQGGPGFSTTVMNLHVWRNFGEGAFAYAATINLVLFLLIALTALPMIRILRRREIEL